MRVLLAACLLLAVAGCGDDSSPRPSAATPMPTATPVKTTGTAEQRAVAAVLERYAQAVRSGDARAICTRLLSREVLRRVQTAGGECERDLIADAIAAGGPSYALKVASVAVTGRRASARTVVTDIRGTRPQVQPLVREAGGWRLSVS
jgi:hypothetical protein